jgi:hypothetical protein
LDATLDLIWHKQAPLKVSIMAWRLLRNRLPTKENLVVRGIISHDNQLCVTGCGGIKTAHHLFLSLVPVSILCGVLFGRDLAFHRLIFTIYRILLFSLFILQEGRDTNK